VRLLEKSSDLFSYPLDSNQICTVNREAFHDETGWLLLGRAVFLDVLQRLLTLLAGWQRHRPLGGGGGIVFGNGLGVAEDGSVLGGSSRG
jgi:hypothetical protein